MTSAKKARYKLFAAMLTTYGYGLLGVPTFQQFMVTGKATWTMGISFIVGMVFHSLALYIAPKGEP